MNRARPMAARLVMEYSELLYESYFISSLPPPPHHRSNCEKIYCVTAPPSPTVIKYIWLRHLLTSPPPALNVTKYIALQRDRENVRFSMIQIQLSTKTFTTLTEYKSIWTNLESCKNCAYNRDKGILRYKTTGGMCEHC